MEANERIDGAERDGRGRLGPGLVELAGAVEVPGQHVVAGDRWAQGESAAGPSHGVGAGVVVGVEQSHLEVDVHPVRPVELGDGPDERVARADRLRLAGGGLGVALRNDVLGQRGHAREPGVNGRRLGVSPFGDEHASLPGGGGGQARERLGGGGVGRLGGRDVA